MVRVFSVRKPTVDGIVNSIEAFDELDRNVLLMFGERKPGKPELEQWRALVARIEKEQRRNEARPRMASARRRVNRGLGVLAALHDLNMRRATPTGSRSSRTAS